MIRRRTALRPALALAAGLSLLPAAMADDPQNDADLKKMQGVWVSKDDQGESTWTFKGDRLSLKTPTRSYEIKLTIDAAAKPIPAMDMKGLADSPNAADYKGLAIYKFDGDKKLAICFGGEEVGRPK